MKIADVPTLMGTPFGEDASAPYIRTVPVASQIGINDGYASFETGFVPLNMTPKSAGGVPPFGQDMNGVLLAISRWSRWQGCGAPVPWNADFAIAISGYPEGATVEVEDLPGHAWVSLVDDNASDPEDLDGSWQMVTITPPVVGRIIDLADPRWGFRAGDQAFDNTVPWNLLIPQLTWGDVIQLAGAVPVAQSPFTNGAMWFNTSRPAALPNGVTLRGNGGWGVMVRNYAVAATTDAFIRWGSESSTVENVFAYLAAGVTNGTAYGFIGDVSNFTNHALLRQCFTGVLGTVDAGHSWSFGVYSDCILNGQGIRNMTLECCEMFGTNTAAYSFKHAINLNMSDCTHGSAFGVAMILDGASGAPTETATIAVSNFGVIQMDWCDNVIITGTVGGTPTYTTHTTNTIIDSPSDVTAPSVIGTNNYARFGSKVYQSSSVLETASQAVQGDEVHRFAASETFYNLFAGAQGSPNAAGCIMKLGYNTSTSRSLNAAGSLNASGAGVAEYVKKREDCGTIAKGDPFGMDAHGLATDRWSLARTFGVKSTNPGFTVTGPDSHGTIDTLGKEPERPSVQDFTRKDDPADEARAGPRFDRAGFAAAVQAYEAAKNQFNDKLESERIKFDRREIAGVTVINIEDGETGDFVVPVELDGDKIGAKAVRLADMTLADSLTRVGRIARVDDDGTRHLDVRGG